MAISNFIPTIWSEHLLRALDQKYVGVANCNRDYEGEIKEIGNTVKICGVGNVTVSTYTKNTNMGSPETLTDSAKSLVIDQAKYFNFQLDDIDHVQCSPKLMQYAMDNAARSLSIAADTYVYSLVSGAGYTITNNNASVNNVVDTILAARTRLFKQGVTNADDIVIEVAPEIGELILKAKANLCTDNSESLEGGCIGKIGGCKIYVSNNVAIDYDDDDNPIYKCMARTTRAIAFAEQLSEIDAYRPELRFADAVKGLHLYGAKVIYPNEVVQVKFMTAA